MIPLLQRVLGAPARHLRLRRDLISAQQELERCRSDLARAKEHVPLSPLAIDWQSVSANDLEAVIQQSGYLSIEVAGVPIRLDLQNPHERRYVAGFLGFKYPQSDIDTLLLRRLIRPGDVVLDAGANIGMTALEALEAGASHVHAFEPVPDLARRIRGLNCSSITCYETALSDKPGTVDLFLSRTHNQGSTITAAWLNLFPSVYTDNREIVQVKCMNVDSLDEKIRRAAIWKIDVEGAEADLVRGAADTLRTTPPRAIILEIFDPVYEELVSVLRETHPYFKRAAIARHDYALRFVDKTEVDANPDRYHVTVPTYVFATHEDLFK